MSYIKIGVFNESTTVTDAEVTKWVTAIQKQIRRDWAPIWGYDADLIWQPKGSKPRSGMWHVVIFDDADQAGVLGYHDLTPEGLPLAKVFAKTTKTYGGQPSCTLSHEVLEMLADPDINLIAAVTDPNAGTKFYAYEVCDAVEADNLGYDIYGVRVSDFVTPAWFESFRAPHSTQFSFMKRIAAPFQLAPGGYIPVYDPSTGWSQVTARHTYSYESRPHPGSRRERRVIHRHHWMKTHADPFRHGREDNADIK